MTYGKRNILIVVGLVFTVLVIAGFPLATLLSGRSGWVDHPLSRLPSHSWWLSYGISPPTRGQYIWYAAALLALVLLVFAACLILRSIYRRTASEEVFFFLLFLFTYPFELLRSWNAVLSLNGSSVFVTVVCARIIYFGRFFGWTSLFISSLYAIRIRYRNLGILLLVALLLSLTLASALPLDSSDMLADYLYRLGDEAAVLFVLLICQLFSTINYFVAAFRRQNRRFTVAALAVLLTILGKVTIVFLGSPAQSMIGLFLSAAGISLFIRQMNQIHLWI